MRRLDPQTRFQLVFHFSPDFFFPNIFLLGSSKMPSSCFVLLSFLFDHHHNICIYTFEWTAACPSIVAIFLFISQIERKKQKKTDDVREREREKRLRSSGLVYIISNRPRTRRVRSSTRSTPATDWRERERPFQHIPPFFPPLSASRIIYRDYL